MREQFVAGELHRVERRGAGGIERVAGTTQAERLRQQGRGKARDGPVQRIPRERGVLPRGANARLLVERREDFVAQRGSRRRRQGDVAEDDAYVTAFEV